MNSEATYKKITLETKVEPGIVLRKRSPNNYDYYYVDSFMNEKNKFRIIPSNMQGRERAPFALYFNMVQLSGLNYEISEQ